MDSNRDKDNLQRMLELAEFGAKGMMIGELLSSEFLFLI